MNMYMTLDGYDEFPKYPGSDVPSKEPGEGFTNMWIRRYDSVDTTLYGRKSYEGRVAVHSESARSDPGSDKTPPRGPNPSTRKPSRILPE